MSSVLNSGWNCPKCGDAFNAFYWDDKLPQCPSCDCKMRTKDRTRIVRVPAAHGDVRMPYYSSNHGCVIGSKRDIREAQRRNGTVDFSDRDLRDAADACQSQQSRTNDEIKMVDKWQKEDGISFEINDDPNVFDAEQR